MYCQVITTNQLIYLVCVLVQEYYKLPLTNHKYTTQHISTSVYCVDYA